VLGPEELNKRPDIRKRIYKDDFIDYEEGRSVDSMFFNQQRQFVPYPPIREADVLWSKQIWRDIEVGEKINLPLYYPITPIDDRKSLFDIIVEAYRAKRIVPFEGKEDFFDGQFKQALTVSVADSTCFGRKYSEETFDDEGNSTGFKDRYTPYGADDVITYRLKEYWYFDKQRSQMMVKILGLMPIVSLTDNATGERKPQATAWFYYPELRGVLCNVEVYNRKNETVRLTFDDVFIKRYFSSHIIKEDNVFNRTLAQAGYVGFDQLVESDRVKEKIFNFEHDLWDY
ncbi:MAG TPA: gliding motility protein GldN, partial [Luteibaculaceae bacterium]|nr:gliding motility protein GldN [Luteibaculaceae bacterium]